MNELSESQRKSVIDTIADYDDGQKQILKDELSKIGQADGYTDAEDFVTKIRQNGGDGDFSNGLKATIQKRSQKVPWYKGKRAKWNKIKSYFSKVTSTAKFQVSFVWSLHF